MVAAWEVVLVMMAVMPAAALITAAVTNSF
jgi:hypothetical protein